MPDLPLLVFPTARDVTPPDGRSLPRGKPHFPAHDIQLQRLAPQIAEIQTGFERYSASLTGALEGLEPEAVLVLHIAGEVDDFIKAIENTEGLEWLGEWDTQEVPDDNFWSFRLLRGCLIRYSPSFPTGARRWTAPSCTGSCWA